MILSEYERRWVEVKFYHFMTDLYAIRNKTVDIIDVIEMVCQIGKLNTNLIKKVANGMLSDTYYQPNRREILLLGHLHKISNEDLGNYIGISRQNAWKYIKNNIDNYVPIPRCQPDTDAELEKFLKVWSKIRSAGLYVNTDENTI